MIRDAKIRQGAKAWFEMVGTLMIEAATRSGLSPDLNVSLVEQYTDGVELSAGLIQGIRFDIRDGRPSFRAGARRNEQADIVVEVTAAAARKLNLMRGLAYHAALDRFLSTGEMKVSGNFTRLGAWLDAVHDPIVDRTRP